METSPLQPRVVASNVPLNRLAQNESLTEQQKTGEVCRQFEAMLLRQILQESQKTVIPSSLTKDSAAKGIYQDMVTTQMADGISRAGSFGLANCLRSQLARQIPVRSPEASKPAANPGEVAS